MELTVLHFYPDLMSLYGSYANVAALRRQLEALGNTVRVEAVAPGADVPAALEADFLFLGAGTERSQKAALSDLLRYREALIAAAERGMPMLFCGTAMELLGQSITDDQGTVFPALGLASFTSVQSRRRIVEDVCGATDLYAEPVVGFLNKCSILSGVEAPLLTFLSMGFGNEAPLGAEGYHRGNVFASQLTGPLLVKNPRLLDAVVDAVYRYRGECAPTVHPADSYAEAAFDVTAEQLGLRCGK